MRAIRFFAYVATLLISSTPLVAAASEGFEVTNAATFTSGLKVEQPIDVNLDVGGVKLVSVYFDTTRGEAFAILQNRTPVATTPTLAIALMDAKGKLLATGIDASGFSFSGEKIGPGEQKNVVLAFSKFVNDFKSVSSFQLVLSLGKAKEAQGKPATVPNYGG